MKAWQEYFSIMQEVVKKRKRHRKEYFKGGRHLRSAQREGSSTFWLRPFGLVTEDVFWRAATMANVHASLNQVWRGSTRSRKADSWRDRRHGTSLDELPAHHSSRCHDLHFQFRQQCHYH